MSYADTNIFLNGEQRLRLQRDLKLPSAEAVDAVIKRVNGAVGYYRFREEIRDAVPDVKTARANVTAIVNHGKALSGAISSAVFSEYFFIRENSHDEQGLQNEFLQTLADVMRRAEDLMQNETSMREIYFLPASSAANKTLKTQYLWPSLFEIYQSISGNVTYSPGGPLERFVTVVHEVAGLDQPASATLRMAALNWRMDKAREDEP